MRAFLRACLLLCLAFPLKGGGPRPELISQAGHTGPVGSAAFRPDGRVLATGAKDRTVRLWDAGNGRLLRTLGGFDSEVWRVAYAPGGKVLATTTGNPQEGEGCDIQFWDAETGAPLGRLKGHTQGIGSLAFSPDGRCLVTGSADGSVRVWDVAAGRCLRTYPGELYEHRTAAISPDGRRLALGGGEHPLELRDLATGGLVRRFGPQTEGLWAVAFRPGTGQLAAAGARDGETKVVVREARTGKVLYELTGHTSRVHGLSFSADGRWLASVSGAETLVWDAATGRRVATLAGNGFAAFHPTAPLVATGDAGSSHVKLMGEVDVQTGSPDVVLWSLPAGQQVQRLGGHAREEQNVQLLSYGVAASPGGRWLVRRMGGPTGVHSLALWDVQSAGGPARHPGWGSLDALVAFAPDGRTLAVTRGGVEVLLWEVGQAKLRRLARVPGGAVRADRLVFSPDGACLALAADGGTTLWDVASGQVLRALPGREPAWSPDGSRLFLLDAEGAVRVQDLRAEGGSTRLPGPNGLAVMALQADGGRLAAAGGGQLHVWDLADGRVHSFETGLDSLTSLAFSPDGRVLVGSGWADDNLFVWDPATGRCLHRLGSPDARTVSVDARTPFTFLEGGRFVVRGLRHLQVWELATGRAAATLTIMGNGDWMVVTPEGWFDGSPGAWREFLWRLGPGLHDVAPPEAFFNEFYRPGLLQEVLSGQCPSPPVDLQALDRRLPEVRLQALGGLGPSGATRVLRVRLDAREGPPDAPHPTGSGLRDVRLFRNGTLVKAWRGAMPLDGAGQASLEADVTLQAGPNRITAYAFNGDDIRSPEAVLEVAGSSSLARQGIAYVVAAGVDAYPQASLRLAFAVADARLFAEELEAQLGRTGRFQRVEVVRLMDQEATKAHLRLALARLAGRAPDLPPGSPAALARLQPAQPEDAVFLAFAGHGVAQGDRFYLLPQDQLPGDLGAHLAERGLSDLDLAQDLEALDAGEVLFVLDACQSGRAFEGGARRPGPVNSRGLAQLAYDKGLHLLAAAGGDQAALEARKLAHGLLTFALVEEGLREGQADRDPRDGAITVREWLEFAVAEVPRLQRSLFGPARDRGVALVSGEDDAGLERSLQRPRIFYRRDRKGHPLVVGRR